MQHDESLPRAMTQDHGARQQDEIEYYRGEVIPEMQTEIDRLRNRLARIEEEVRALAVALNSEAQPMMLEPSQRAYGGALARRDIAARLRAILDTEKEGGVMQNSNSKMLSRAQIMTAHDVLSPFLIGCEQDWLDRLVYTATSKHDTLARILDQVIVRDESVPEWAIAWCKDQYGNIDYAMAKRKEEAPDYRPDLAGPVTLPIVSLRDELP